MNIAPLRQSIIKETIIFITFAAIFGGASIYLHGLYEEAEKKKTAALAAVSQTTEERKKIENQFGAVKESLPVYRESVQYMISQGLYIDSQAVRDLFNQYQPKYTLKKSSVEMQPITELSTDPKYTRKTFVATKSDVHVTMESLSDEDIYTLIQMMQKELPGYVRIKTFSVAKKQELSKEVLATVRKEGTFPMIAAEVTFDWFGMKAVDVQSSFNRYIPIKREVKPQ